ncbi:MAG: DegT/DnrJ/EryC1/StrS family aminotransferase [Spirochaetes bacterium]|nr:DegT/DnrJ/EryC1/StrS family aminotransferase [Spirochaetota bacterium]
MIPVSKPYLPSRRKLDRYINQIYKNCYLTNNGPLLQLLEKRLQKYLGVRNIICVANGSLALQLVYKALDLKGEVITTPFSFVATTSTLVWEGLTPRFADIDPETLNISPDEIQKQISPQTCAILPVHVYGNPCDVNKIDNIAKEHGLKVIYDAAHAFGVKKNGQSVLNYGDASILSFHATKLFHTVEGGAVVTNDDDLAKKIRSLINFGFDNGVSVMAGTNAKMNEFEAAMGLAVLDDIDKIRNKRKELYQLYREGLGDMVDYQKWDEKSECNHVYMPLMMDSEDQVISLTNILKGFGIISRRYFYPVLNELCYVEGSENKISLDVSKRIICVPLYCGLSKKVINTVVSAVKQIKSI